MPDDNDKLNKLLGQQGSIAERTKIAKQLNDDSLQMAAPYSQQAKEELERRRHGRLTASIHPPISGDELELLILRKYVDYHRKAELTDPSRKDKCARELDMREVIAEITGESGRELEYTAELWHAQLAPKAINKEGPLRPCSDTRINNAAHHFNARAYRDGGNAPAWTRIRELEARLPHPSKQERELEQKFRILNSHAQMQRDFDQWMVEAAGDPAYSVGVIFLDIDGFKKLNSKFTESVVDKTLLPDLQGIIARLCMHRGAGYRHGGEEFVILLPNCSVQETATFAEKVRRQISDNDFCVEQMQVQVTVSVGVAGWPLQGDTLTAVVEKANELEHTAKELGKNRVSIAIS